MLACTLSNRPQLADVCRSRARWPFTVKKKAQAKPCAPGFALLAHHRAPTVTHILTSPAPESSHPSTSTALPSTAQHLVQRHEIGLPRKNVRRELLLRGVERALRVEEGEKAVRARLVARLGERVIALRRRYIFAIRLHLIDVSGARRQRIRHLLECCLDRAF